MNFNDDKDDFFDGPDIQEVPKTPKAPLLKPEDPDYWEQDEPEFEHLLPPRRNTTIWLCVAAAVLAVSAFIAVYLWFLSPLVTESVQYGYLEDIEKRGEVFKTYEGTILPYKELMDTTRVYRKDFVFSVKDPAVAVELRRLQYANLPARVEYEKYHGSLPWRGESRIMVVRVDTADPAKILPPEFAPDI